MIGIDAESLCDDDDDDDTDGNDDKEPVLDLNGQARVQVDITFCHELFHGADEPEALIGPLSERELETLEYLLGKCLNRGHR